MEEISLDEKAGTDGATGRASRKYKPGESPRERIIDAARKLFGAKGFRSTTTAELAAEASVSMGQIYRHFASKDDIVLAIVEQNSHERLSQMNAVFEAVEGGRCSIFEAVKAIAEISLCPDDASLTYEIMAEANRNPHVTEKVERLIAFYTGGIRRLATLARPDVSDDYLDAYVDIMMACFIGLGFRTTLEKSFDPDHSSTRVARLLLQALGIHEE